MSDPNMDQAATQGEAPDQDAGTPDSLLNMGTTVVGGPVDPEPDRDQPIDPDTGQPADPNAP
jgi:hypothetical protein